MCPPYLEGWENLSLRGCDSAPCTSLEFSALTPLLSKGTCVMEAGNECHSHQERGCLDCSQDPETRWVTDGGKMASWGVLFRENGCDSAESSS